MAREFYKSGIKEKEIGETLCKFHVHSVDILYCTKVSQEQLPTSAPCPGQMGSNTLHTSHYLTLIQFFSERRLGLRNQNCQAQTWF